MINNKKFFSFCVVRASISFLIMICVAGCTVDDALLENKTGATTVTYRPFVKEVGITKESQTWIFKAIEALKEKKFRDASQNINKALKYDSQNSYLHYLNGLTYHLWGISEDPAQLANALEGYKVALQFDSGNTMASRNLGKLYLDSHQYSKAQNQYADGVLSDPSNSSMMKGLIISSYLNQDVDTALQGIALLEKQGTITSDMYQVASLVYAAAGESSTAHSYFQKMKKISKDAHTLRYIEGRLKAWNEFYLVVSKKDLAQISAAKPKPEKKKGPFAKLGIKEAKGKQNIRKGKNKQVPFEDGFGDDFEDNQGNNHKGKKKQSSVINTDEKKFAYIPYLEQGAADEDFGDDSEDSSDDGFGEEGGNSGGGSEGGFGGSGGGSFGGGFGGSGDGSGGGSFGGFGDGEGSSEGGGFGDSESDSENGFPEGLGSGLEDDNDPLANEMIVIDVAIVRTEQIENESRGNNLLEALGNLTQGNNNPLVGYGFNISPPSTRGRTVAYSLTIPQLKYSLNIANDSTSYNDILATPTLVATNGKPSTFFSGTDVTLALTGTQGGGNLVTKEVGITLNVTPKFLKDGRISLKVTAGRTIFSQNELPGNTNSPTITTPVLQADKSSVQATATLAPGESLLLSGLTEKYYLKSSDKTPGLGDTPLLSYIFGNAASQRIERSMIFVLTPHFPKRLIKDASGNYIPLTAKEAKQKEQESVIKMKETYPTSFKTDTSKSFLAKLQESEYSRHFRPNDMPETDSDVISNYAALLTEVLPYVTRSNYKF